MNKLNLKFTNFEKILLAIILGLILVIVAGTIIVKTQQKDQKAQSQNSQELISQGKAVSLMAPSDDTQVAYYELGKIRITTKAENADEGGTILLVSPWLAYPAGDTVFYEEIARKSGLVKGIFQTYFSEHTKTQLLQETEPKIEENLKSQINAQLSLGKISDIYFTDYIFLFSATASS